MEPKLQFAVALMRNRGRPPDRYELDPTLIAISPLAFTLSEYERIGEQNFAQSWLVRSA